MARRLVPELRRRAWHVLAGVALAAVGAVLDLVCQAAERRRSTLPA